LKRYQEEHDAALFQRLVAGTPKLWILSYRFLPFRGEIAAITRHGYARVGENLLLAGTRLEPGAGDTRFECRWPGRYRLFDLAGKPLAARFRVDAGAETDEAAIALGSHTVRAAGGDEALLLPADAHDVEALPETAPVPHLFADVYDF